jgi:AraC family transcriptional regulator, regulatory protein of adaptative response / methylated-DNA-[protein]-cysteine methyltransferase
VVPLGRTPTAARPRPKILIESKCHPGKRPNSKNRVESAFYYLYFCNMIETEDINYSRVEEAIKFLTDNFKQQPSLYDVADHANVSPFHFQKIFTEWAGISPKKFLQYLTVEELKKEIKRSENLSEAAERVGLSAQSRVYDLFVNIESVTPNEFKTKGEGIEIEYGVHTTPFGKCLIASTPRGICSMNFLENNLDALLSHLRSHWENATIKKNNAATRSIAENIFSTDKKEKIKLLVKGTPFQIKVWEALLKIPFGSIASYQHIANSLGNPNASRAVGTAIGSNPVAYLIPCHRVIRQEAIIGQYRWGSLRKTALIGWEKAKSDL